MMAMRADDYKTPDELKAWTRSKSTFIQERGGKDVVNNEEIALWMDTASDEGLGLHTPRRMATAKGQEIRWWQRW